jgi:hypothetical protein
MNETPASMNQAFRVAIVILVFFGIFAAGAVTGLVITAHFANRRVEHFMHERQEEARLQEQRDQDDRLRSEKEQQKLVDMVASLREQVQWQSQQPSQQRMASAPGQFGPQLMQRFINQIMPTPEQREKIQPLVYQAAEDLRRLRRDTAHSTELILEQLQDQIATLLTPEQRGRFDAMIQKSRNAFKRYNFEQQLRQQQQRQQEQREQQP